jgi:thiamine-phosphate pyrophosphorylase
MKPNVDYTLYLVTDRDLMSSATITESVEQALRGGVTLVHLREKTASSRDFYDVAHEVHAITQRYGVPLIINDRADVALAIGAEGVHVGQEDLPAAEVRRLLGPDAIVGVSAGNLAEAVAAEAAGADYIGVGAMYATDTKADAEVITMDELRQIRAVVHIPLVVIGGINQMTVPDFAGIDIDGVAVVTAIIAQPDVAAAAQELKDLVLTTRTKTHMQTH